MAVVKFRAYSAKDVARKTKAFEELFGVLYVGDITCELGELNGYRGNYFYIYGEQEKVYFPAGGLDITIRSRSGN